MRYLPISNIFNYLPRAVRNQMNDDDLIMSWAFQAYRKIDNKGLQMERKIEFRDISSYQAQLPQDFVSVHKVSFLENADATSIAELYNCPDCEDEREENRDNPCPLTHRYFLNSAFYQSTSWRIAVKTGILSDDFFCKATPLSCNPLYHLRSDKGIIYTSISSGLLALDYYSFLKNEDGEMLLPEMPVVMWEYLSRHIERRFLQERNYMPYDENINGARSRAANRAAYQEAYASEVSLLNHWRAHGMLSNLNIKNIEAIQSNQIIHSADTLRKHLTTYYAI